MPARFVAEVSGHSTRVGAAQDLAELDIDLAAITQAGCRFQYSLSYISTRMSRKSVRRSKYECSDPGGAGATHAGFR
jgi:hypothetical protein